MGNAMTSEIIVKQLRAVVARYDQTHAAVLYAGENGRWKQRDVQDLLASAQAAIERVAPADSAYRLKAAQSLGCEYAADEFKLEQLIWIVDALCADYEVGALTPIQDLVRAEVFDDFLDMARHLLDEGYKDAAAVMIGGVLENELRKLAERHGVATTNAEGRPAKAEAINTAVASAGVYNKLEQKTVTAWLDLRNKAAHAHYDQYTREHVEAMFMDVRAFVARFSSGQAAI